MPRARSSGSPATSPRSRSSPCFDVWEENGTACTPRRSACVYGGLDRGRRAARTSRTCCERAARGPGARARARPSAPGYYAKSSESDAVDASMLWLRRRSASSRPATRCSRRPCARSSEQLTLEGGIRRYPSDTYYGGGAWPVLTASLGWHHGAAGDLDGRAPLPRLGRRAHRRGRAARASSSAASGAIPSTYREWVERWGQPARELLWSHAMYVGAVRRSSSASAGSAGLTAGRTPRSCTTAVGKELVMRRRQGSARRRAGAAAGQPPRLCGAGRSSALAGSRSAAARRQPVPRGTVTLQFWSAYNVADKEASTMANVIIPKFEKENPGIKVDSDRLPVRGAAAEVPGCIGGGRPAGPAALGHRLGPAAGRAGPRAQGRAACRGSRRSRRPRCPGRC